MMKLKLKNIKRKNMIMKTFQNHVKLIMNIIRGNLNKKKVFMIVSEILIGSVGLSVGSGLTISGLAPVGFLCASSISFLLSISILFTKENLSELKIRYSKLRDWINVITWLYEKILKASMVDKNIDQTEAVELKKIFNHYLDKRKKS